MIRALLILLSFIFCDYLSFGQQSFENKLQEIYINKAFEYASLGLSVRNEVGKEILKHNSDLKLIPASSHKLLITLSALEILGPDYSFTTKVGYTGSIDRAGTLDGNIVIIGSGDPTLGAKRFGISIEEVLSQISSSIKKVGIKCIDGRIEIRANVFDGQATPGSWPYSDIANYYGSGAWALNFNENEYELYFKQRVKENQLAQVEEIKPSIPFLNIKSEVVTKGPRTGDNAYIYGDPFNYNKIVRGSIPYANKPFKIRGSIPNPPLSFAALISVNLETSGISNNGFVVKQKPIKKSDFISLTRFNSRKLIDIVQQANYESLNMYCEALLRLMGKKEKGIGSIEAGLEVIESRLVDMGINKYSFHLEDGSGLSPRNNITASTFTKYLNVTQQKLDFNKFLKVMPQTGVSGTVSTLLNEKASQKKFYLKSGSMGGVLSYTGFFTAKSGSKFNICFISNNHSHGNRAVKREVEKLFELLYQQL